VLKLAVLFRKVAGLAGVGVKIEIAPDAHFNRLGLRMRAGDTVRIGTHSIVDASLRTDRSPAEIIIGDRSFVSGGSLLVAAQRVEIGDDVQISWDVTIVDHDSHALEFELRRDDVLEWGAGRKDWTHVTVAPVKICDKAWIGFGATILKGITVGEGAVVGAKSVVTRDVAPWTVVAGNPAREIRKLTPAGAA
jgi:acetyltransferase-like isoleucine patch superfamily enzyme